MGGGRRNFKPVTQVGGYRVDGRDLIQEWQNIMSEKKLSAKYVTNLTDFNALKPNEYDHVLGTKFLLTLKKFKSFI